jgi:acetyl-CoA acetyltransferase
VTIKDATAIVGVGQTEWGKGLDVTPAYVHGFAQSIPQQHQVMTNYFGDDPLQGPAWTCADLLWRNADLTPDDVDVAQLYDAFSPLVPLSLEGYGFCERGEGLAFCQDRGIAWDGGRLPVNTSGAGLSEAYVHGFNLVTEGVRQLRGTSTAQVAGARSRW